MNLSKSMTPATSFDDGWFSRLGLAGLYLFAFSSSASTAGASLGLTLLAVGSVFVIVHQRQWFARDQVIQLNLLLIAYLLALASWSTLQHPETSTRQWNSVRELAMLSFPIVGLWVAQNEMRARRVLLVALVGFVLELVVHALEDQADFLRAVNEDPTLFRYTFHKSAATIGLFAAVTLLGLGIFFRSMLGNSSQRWWFSLRFALWLGAVLLTGYALLISWSRASWLALLVSALIAIPASLLRLKRYTGTSSRRQIVIAAALLLSLIISGYFIADRIGDRLAFEQDSYSRLLSGDIETLDDKSVGSRARMLVYGFQLWQQKPWFGWAPARTDLMLDTHPHAALHQFDHLHNTYLELAVRLGMVGLILVLAIVWLSLYRLWQRYRQGLIQPDTFWFLAGSLGLFAIWSAFDVRFDHSDGRHFWLLLGGVIYGLGLPAKRVQASLSPE